MIFLFVIAAMVVATAAPPPPPGPTPHANDTYIGGAPIAGGVLIMIALAASYGARKLYSARKRKISE
ncbi:MAG: hypothetical protein ABFS05_08705 [Bacteroidota bacterium]